MVFTSVYSAERFILMTIRQAWSEQRRVYMRQHRKQGMKLESIAELFGVHHSTVLYAISDQRRDSCRDRGIAAARRKGCIELSPIDQVRAKLADLREQGIGIKSIYAVTGVSPRSLAKIRNGRQTRIRPENAAKILAMDHTCIADRGLIDPQATWQRLRELIGDGWPEHDLARLMGLNPRNRRIAIGITNVSAKTALRVQKLYDAIQAGKIRREE